MEPILAVWGGLYINGNNSAPGDVISQADIGIYVQEAMNELEFLMGSNSTTYGALRTSLGCPLSYAHIYRSWYFD